MDEMGCDDDAGCVDDISLLLPYPLPVSRSLSLSSRLSLSSLLSMGPASLSRGESNVPLGLDSCIPLGVVLLSELDRWMEFS